jgi:hypothetical protein
MGPGGLGCSSSVLGLLAETDGRPLMCGEVEVVER